MAHRSSTFLVVALLGLFATACGEARPHVDARGTALSTTVGNELAGVAPAMPVGERMLDTSTANVAPTPAPVTTTRAPKSHKPGSDENLPSWVPVRGRLTVVEAPDLAENLGLVPKGTTKSTEGRISVAELMANGTLATSTPRTTPAPAAKADSGPRSATWLASNGRVRHARGR